MTFPPEDQCTSEDLDNLADLVVRDPRASWDLAGSREHIEALCRRYQALAQDRADLIERDARHEQARERLGKALSKALDDLEAARRGISEREDEIGRVNNERQAEINEAAAQRERADEAEAVAEIFEVTARAALAILARGRSVVPIDLADLARAVDGRLSRALVRERQVSARLAKQVEDMAMLLDQQRQTRRLDDQLRSTCHAETGRDYEVVQQDLDAELVAHPDVAPLHHARDQRDHQEDTAP